MSHENYAPRLSGNLMAFPIRLAFEGRGIGPLAAVVVEQQAQAEMVRVLDTRRSKRGQTVRAFPNPKEAIGALELVTIPARMLASLFLGEASPYAATAATVAALSVPFEEDFWTQLPNRHLAAGSLAITRGVRATLATGTAQANTGLTYTAVPIGAAGNAPSVTYVEPAGNDQPLAVSVVGSAITVSLATGPTGDVTSTAAQVLAAVAASADALALVTIAATGESTGAGVLAAAAAASLSGGAAGTAVAASAFEVNERLGIWRPVLGNGVLSGTGACLASYTALEKSGVQVTLGTETTVRARLALDAVDDGGHQMDVQWHAYSAVITPDGPINLMSETPITAKFKLEFETPDGYDSPTLLIWPDGEPQ